MKNKIALLCSIFLILFCSTLFSQEAGAEQQGLSQFDFWLGEWNCEWKDQNGDTQKSSNLVRKILDGKVIEENFDGRPGLNLIGKSHSVFDVNSGKWKQTWVDNSGGYLDFSGGIKDGKMILSRKAKVNDSEFLQRMVWYNITENGFDWNWERSDDGGKTWTVKWEISYLRMSN